MKRILFISHKAFPVTGAENIVNSRLLSVLSKSGEFQIDLITKKNFCQDYPSNSLEEYGIRLNSLNMVEVDNKVTIITIWQHFCAWIQFGLLAKGYHWAFMALPIAKKLVKENNYDYVLTKSEPAFLLGNYLNKKYGLKWVSTWNDPNPQYPKPYGKGNGEKVICKYRKKISIMKNADVFIYPSSRLATYMNAYLKSDIKDIHIIPHVMMQEPKVAKELSDNTIRLIHSGNCTQTRRAKKLLTAIINLLSDGLIQKDDLSISFLGKIEPEDEVLIKNSVLKNMVYILEPVPYLSSLKILEDYDVAIIIEAEWEEGIFLPTKVSDFMMEGKRIFTISPKDGLLHDLYNQGYVSYFANVQDVESIKKTLLQIVKDRKKTTWNKYKVKIPSEYRPEYVVQQYLSL